MAKKAAASKGKTSKSAAPKKPATKSELYNLLSEKTDLTKKQVSDFFDALGDVIKADLSKKGPGSITLPGLLKLRRAEKGPTKARKGINPRTGEEITIAAKPKTVVVRARVLKNLQETVK